MPFIVYRNGEAVSWYWRYNQPLANCRRRLVYDETTEAKTTLFENRQPCINFVLFFLGYCSQNGWIYVRFLWNWNSAIFQTIREYGRDILECGNVGPLPLTVKKIVP